jgi:GTPase SAR1 family protein
MVPIILVGNKQDLAANKSGCRQVDTRQVNADWIDSGEAIEYMETSAVTLKNIENLFVSIADQANDY